MKDREGGPGTTFEVMLPLKPETPNATGIRPAQPRTERDGSSLMAQQHILIVEDEQHLAVGIKFNLEAEGYRVTHVGDGSSALNLIQRTRQTTSTC